MSMTESPALTGEQQAALAALPQNARGPHAYPITDQHAADAFPSGTIYARTAFTEAIIQPGGTVLVLRERSHISAKWRDVNVIETINGIDVPLGELREGDSLRPDHARSVFERGPQVQKIERLPENRIKVTLAMYPQHDPRMRSSDSVIHTAVTGSGAGRQVIEGDAQDTVRIAWRAGEGMTVSGLQIRNVKTGERRTIA